MVRTGTAHFWDMYWHPEATSRAVRDAGLRATVGGPLFGLGDEIGELGPSRPRPVRAPARVRVGGNRGLARAPLDLHRRRAAPAAHRRLSAERELPIHIHLSETEAEVDRLPLRPWRAPRRLPRSPRAARRAHLARPRGLARPRRARADRRARLHGRHQPGREHEASCRRGLPAARRPARPASPSASAPTEPAPTTPSTCSPTSRSWHWSSAMPQRMPPRSPPPKRWQIATGRRSPLLGGKSPGRRRPRRLPPPARRLARARRRRAPLRPRLRELRLDRRHHGGRRPDPDARRAGRRSGGGRRAGGGAGPRPGHRLAARRWIAAPDRV